MWLIFLVFSVQFASGIDFVHHFHNFDFGYTKLFSDSSRLINYDGVSPECATDFKHISDAINNKRKHINDTFGDKVLGSCKYFSIKRYYLILSN